VVFYNGGAIKYQRGFLQRKKTEERRKKRKKARKCRNCVLDRLWTFAQFFVASAKPEATKRVSI